MSVCRPQLPGTPERVRVSASLALPLLLPTSPPGLLPRLGAAGAGVRCVSVGLSGRLHAGGCALWGPFPVFSLEQAPAWRSCGPVLGDTCLDLGGRKAEATLGCWPRPRAGGGGHRGTSCARLARASLSHECS